MKSLFQSHESLRALIYTSLGNRKRVRARERDRDRETEWARERKRKRKRVVERQQWEKEAAWNCRHVISDQWETNIKLENEMNEKQ